MRSLSQESFFRRGSVKEQKARKQTDFSTKTNRKYSFTCCYEKEILRFSKDKVKIEEKLCCPEPDGDEPLHWIVVGSPKKFFLLYKLLLVRKLKQTYKSQIQEGA